MFDKIIESAKSAINAVKTKTADTWNSGTAGKVTIVALGAVAVAAVVTVGWLAFGTTAVVMTAAEATAIVATTEVVAFSAAGILSGMGAVQLIAVGLVTLGLVFNVAGGNFKAVAIDAIFLALLLSPIGATVAMVILILNVLAFFGGMIMAFIAAIAYSATGSNTNEATA